MIVSPNQGAFFVATALMCSGSLYAAELSSRTDPMTRMFVGEPNRLTVPPGFPGDEPIAEGKASALQTANDCNQAGGSTIPVATQTERDCDPANEVTAALSAPLRRSNAPTLTGEAVAQPVGAASATATP